MFSDNVNYTVSESQHTGPANQSEPDSLGGGGFIEPRTQQTVLTRTGTAVLPVYNKVKVCENKIFETKHEYMFHCTP